MKGDRKREPGKVEAAVLRPALIIHHGPKLKNGNYHVMATPEKKQSVSRTLDEEKTTSK